MAEGSEVLAKPLYGPLAHVLPDYNSGLANQDSEDWIRPLGVLAVNSQVSWHTLASASLAQSAGGFRTSFSVPVSSDGNRRTRSFYDIFYERIHYDPAGLRLGQLLNSQTRPVAIWNSFFETRVLTNVTAVNDEGLDFAYGSVPQNFAPLQEKTFTLSVTVDGPPSINATYTFVWDHLSHPYQVTGERITVLAFPPDPTTDFTERFKWYGTITKAYGGPEQRMALNDNPKISYEFKTQVMDEEMQLFDSIMWGWQNRSFAVPVWNSYTKTSQVAGQGSSVLLVEDTAHREFKVDGLALVFAGPDMYESVEVAEVLPDRLVLKKPLTRSWTRRVAVIPVRTMRMAKEISYGSPVANFKEINLSLVAEVGEAVPTVAWARQYLGLPVLDFSPDMAGDVSGTYERDMTWDEGEYSLPLIVDRTGVGSRMQNWQFTWADFAEVQSFKSLLAQLRGTQGEFWASTWAPDMTLARPTDPNSNFLRVAAARHSSMYFDRRGRSDILILLRDGTQLYRRIISATLGTGEFEGTETIALSEPIPQALTPNRVTCISFLVRSRFANEAFEFKWKAQNWASSAVMIKGLTDGV